MWQCERLVIVGAGNMGGALAQGVLRSGMLGKHQLAAIDPSASAQAAMSVLGVQTHETLAAWGAAQAQRYGATLPQPDCSRVLLLAIKPQMLAGFAEQLAALRATDCLPQFDLVISILAGVSRDRVQRELSLGVPCIRAMPNLPALLGEGATAVCDDGVQVELASFARRLFASVGPCVINLPESLIDAFTAVAGSGPAYLFLLAEAMIDGAKEVGLSEADARAAVSQTLMGAARMLSQPSAECTNAGLPTDASILRARVTSPGGTTQAALAVLHDRDVKRAMQEAIVRARDRARELGK